MERTTQRGIYLDLASEVPRFADQTRYSEIVCSNVVSIVLAVITSNVGRMDRATFVELQTSTIYVLSIKGMVETMVLMPLVISKVVALRVGLEHLIPHVGSS